MTVALDPTIGPIVTDSAYADAYTVVSDVGTNYTVLPSWFTPAIVLAGKFFFAWMWPRSGRSTWCGRIPSVPGSSSSAPPTHRLRAPRHRPEGASANPNTELWMVDGCQAVQRSPSIRRNGSSTS